MSVHSNHYENQEDYIADLKWEYRKEQEGLYWNDDDIPNPDMCDSCKHYHFLKMTADGKEEWECDTGFCEYEEKEPLTAVWGIDYDMHNDKCYKCPCCSECKEPIFKFDDDKYHCVSCGEVIEPTEEMLEWFAERSGTKTEMKDCFPTEIKLEDGEVIKMGCGGKKCVEVHYRKNPVTLEWQTMGGRCTECGMNFIV